MGISDLFDRLQALERETGNLYRDIADQLRPLHTSAADLLSRLSSEEVQHDREIEMIRQIVENSKDEQAIKVDEALDERLDAQLGYIREKQALFASGMPDLKASQVMAMALQIELELQESHALRSLHIRNPHIQKLLDGLSEADAAHVALLKDWLHRNP